MIRCLPIASAETAEPALWVDLCQPTDAELDEAAQALGFAIPDRALIGEIEFSSRVRLEGDRLILNLPRFGYEQAQAVAPLGFVLSPRALVTQREHALPALESVEAGLEHPPCAGSVELFMRVIERIVDQLADQLESLESQISETARAAFHQPKRRRATKQLERMLHEVGLMGQRIGGLHNSLHGLLRMATYLDEAAPTWFGQGVGQRITLIHKDLASLGEFEQQLGNRIEFLLDSVLGLINMDQNEVMKVMAVASVVGIPPTVLVGVWGMNFARMPELHWHYGYAISLGAIALSMVVPLLWFRRRGWI